MPAHSKPAFNHLSDTRKRASGSFLSRLLLVSGCVLIAIALAIAAYVAWGYLDAQNRYAQIKSVAGLDVGSDHTVDAATTLEELGYDWDALRALNPDIVAWVKVPNTHIDYPVVQGNDNSYYLYHLFDVSSSGTGAIFADYQGSRSLDAPNNIIYGHNMWDGSMFSDLVMYTSQDFFDQHSVVFLSTPTRNYELRALATSKVSGDAPIRVFDFADDAAYSAYLDVLLASPLAQAADLRAVQPSIQSIYSLVTCNTENNDYRIVLSCLPVRSADPTVSLQDEAGAE